MAEVILTAGGLEVPGNSDVPGPAFRADERTLGIADLDPFRSPFRMEKKVYFTTEARSSRSRMLGPLALACGAILARCLGRGDGFRRRRQYDQSASRGDDDPNQNAPSVHAEDSRFTRKHGARKTYRKVLGPALIACSPVAAVAARLIPGQ